MKRKANTVFEATHSEVVPTKYFSISPVSSPFPPSPPSTIHIQTWISYSLVYYGLKKQQHKTIHACSDILFKVYSKSVTWCFTPSELVRLYQGKSKYTEELFPVLKRRPFLVSMLAYQTTHFLSRKKKKKKIHFFAKFHSNPNFPFLNLTIFKN